MNPCTTEWHYQVPCIPRTAKSLGKELETQNMGQRKVGEILPECEGKVRAPFPGEKGQLFISLKACLSFHLLHNKVLHV